jgi:hypothetical protein
MLCLWRSWTLDVITDREAQAFYEVQAKEAQKGAIAHRFHITWQLHGAFRTWCDSAARSAAAKAAAAAEERAMEVKMDIAAQFHLRIVQYGALVTWRDSVAAGKMARELKAQRACMQSKIDAAILRMRSTVVVQSADKEDGCVGERAESQEHAAHNAGKAGCQGGGTSQLQEISNSLDTKAGQTLLEKASAKFEGGGCAGASKSLNDGGSQQFEESALNGKRNCCGKITKGPEGSVVHTHSIGESGRHVHEGMVGLDDARSKSRYGNGVCDLDTHSRTPELVEATLKASGEAVELGGTVDKQDTPRNQHTSAHGNTSVSGRSVDGAQEVMPAKQASPSAAGHISGFHPKTLAESNEQSARSVSDCAFVGVREQLPNATDCSGMCLNFKNTQGLKLVEAAQYSHRECSPAVASRAEDLDLKPSWEGSEGCVADDEQVPQFDEGILQIITALTESMRAAGRMANRTVVAEGVHVDVHQRDVSHDGQVQEQDNRCGESDGGPTATQPHDGVEAGQAARANHGLEKCFSGTTGGSKSETRRQSSTGLSELGHATPRSCGRRQLQVTLKSAHLECTSKLEGIVAGEDRKKLHSRNLLEASSSESAGEPSSSSAPMSPVFGPRLNAPHQAHACATGDALVSNSANHQCAAGFQSCKLAALGDTSQLQRSARVSGDDKGCKHEGATAQFAAVISLQCPMDNAPWEDYVSYLEKQVIPGEHDAEPSVGVVAPTVEGEGIDTMPAGVQGSGGTKRAASKLTARAAKQAVEMQLARLRQAAGVSNRPFRSWFRTPCKRC